MLFHIFRIREDLCLDDLLMLAHQNLFYQIIASQLIFQLLRRYIFPVCKDDQVLSAAGKEYKTILVHIA